MATKNSHTLVWTSSQERERLVQGNGLESKKRAKSMHGVIKDNFCMMDPTQNTCAFTQYHLGVMGINREYSCMVWLWVQILSSLALLLRL